MRGCSGDAPSAVAACACQRVPASSLSASTPAGGGAGGAPRMFSRIHRPRFTGDVRVGFEVAVKTLAIVITPPREVPSSETR